MSLSNFRALIIFSIILAILAGFVDHFAQSKLPPELVAQTDKLYESLPLWKLMTSLAGALLALLMTIASTYGLFFFRAWAPSLAINATLLAGVSIALLPPLITSGMSEMLSVYGTVLWGAVLAFSKSENYTAEAKRRAEA
jgi:hypothetical protein